jgi:hypothetical protein
METEARIGKGKAPKDMEDSDSEGPALHNISSSLPQPLGKGPLPQETQDNEREGPEGSESPLA